MTDFRMNKDRSVQNNGQMIAVGGSFAVPQAQVQAEPEVVEQEEAVAVATEPVAEPVIVTKPAPKVKKTTNTDEQ